SPVGPLLRAFATQCGPWEGTASELLRALAAKAEDNVIKQKAWPKNGKAMSGALRRLAPTLRALGVNVTFARETDKKRRRLITLEQGTAQAPDDRQTPGVGSASDEREQERF